MKQLLSLGMLALLVLSACGKEENPPSGGAAGESNQPQVSIPANAVVSAYSCRETNEFSESGGPIQSLVVYTEDGVSFAWEEGESFVTYDESKDGVYKNLSKVRVVKLDEQRNQRFIDNTAWVLTNGIWEKTFSQIERVSVKEGNFRRVESNKVNGVERPYYWISEFITISDKSYRAIMRHTNPGMRNDANRTYSKIEYSCDYQDR